MIAVILCSFCTIRFWWRLRGSFKKLLILNTRTNNTARGQNSLQLQLWIQSKAVELFQGHGDIEWSGWILCASYLPLPFPFALEVVFGGHLQIGHGHEFTLVRLLGAQGRQRGTESLLHSYTVAQGIHWPFWGESCCCSQWEQCLLIARLWSIYNPPCAEGFFVLVECVLLCCRKIFVLLDSLSPVCISETCIYIVLGVNPKNCILGKCMNVTFLYINSCWQGITMLW